VKDAWILDSGASSHTQCHMHGLYDAKRTHVQVHGAFSSTVSRCTGKRDLLLPDINGNVARIHLSRVIVLEGYSESLLSLPLLLDEGWKVKFNQDHAVLIKDKQSIRFDKVRGVFSIKEIPDGYAMSNVLHNRLGHANDSVVSKTYGMENFSSEPCQSCSIANMKKSSNVGNTSISRRNEIIFIDLMGPVMNPFRNSGMRYACFIVEGYSRMCHVEWMTNKSQEKVLHCLKSYIIKNGKPDKIRSDNGTEFRNNVFEDFLVEAGIQHELTAPGNPQQNSIAESCIRECCRTARVMLVEAKLGEEFFGYALIHAVYLRNRMSWVRGKSPFEIFFANQPDLSMIRKFGCKAVYKKEGILSKAEARGIVAVYLGVKNESTKCYKLWNNETKRMVESRSVNFFEEDDKVIPVEPSKNDSLEFEDDDGSIISDEPHELSSNPDGSIISDEYHELSSNSNGRKRRINAGVSSPWMDDYVLMNTDDIVKSADITCNPSFNEAMKIPEWKDAIDAELKNMFDNDVFTRVDELPPGFKTLDTVWNFKKKLNQDGSLDKYKARLCARGFRQKEGVDYDETSSPTPPYSIVRFVLAYKVKEGLSIMYLDFNHAFLNAKLEEEIYIKVLGKLYRLNRALYGLKQASLQWYKTLANHLRSLGMTEVKLEPCLFVKKDAQGKITLILIVYIDDCIILYRDSSDIESLKSGLAIKFQFGVKKLSEGFLNIKIEEIENVLELSQEKYIGELVNTFNLMDAQDCDTPSTGELLTMKNADDEKCPGPYEKLVGCLSYIAETTRPEIRYIVSRLARYKSNPSLKHWKSGKRVVKYLKRTKDAKLRISNTCTEGLVCYTDSEWGSDVDDRRSTCGYVIFWNGNLLAWKSVKQKSVALSSMEAEVIALALGVREVIFFKNLLSLMDVRVSPKVYVDNQAAISYVKSFKNKPLSKHIDIRYHYVKELYEAKEFELVYVSGKVNPADIMTKPLTGKVFERARSLLF
jgi:hypothetical protein